MSEEANKEPRYYRTPWPMEFFTNITKAAYVLRANLSEFEHVLAVSPDYRYNDLFQCCRITKPFQKLYRDVVSTMEECLTMVDTILKNDTGKSLPSVVMKLNTLEKIEKLEDMQALFDELNKSDQTCLD